MAPAKTTLYQILGLSPDANDIDIGLAYERRTLELQRTQPPDASEIALARQAFEVLGNPRRRASYDASLLSAAEKHAASAQQAPDLVLESEEQTGGTARIPWIPIGAGAAVVLVVLFFAMRPSRVPDPAAKPAGEPVAEAPKPAPPARPKIRSAPEIMADAVTSGGALLSYEMSGRASPIGIALSTDQGTMVTTCHAIPAGTKLVVKVGNESHPADLQITDEELDLCKLSVADFGTRPHALATEEAKAGDRIYAVGMNAKGELALTEGTIKALRTVPNGKVYELSMPIAASGSGGGVFDEYGRLVGIATTPHKFGAGLNIALPVSWVAQMRSRGRPQ